MNDIPVVVFAYNRPRHLEQALECLRANSVPVLYVYVDGPREGEPSATDEIRSVIERIDWIEPRVVFRPVNLGLSRSIRDGLDSVFARHPAAVVVEDDVWPAPEFYRFAAKSLEHYADDTTIAGVTGLRHPFNTKAFDGYEWDIFFFPRFSSWGWGTWARWWRTLEFDRGRLVELMRKPRFTPAAAGLGFLNRAYAEGSLTGSWDVAASLNMLVHGTLFVYPRWNLIANGGFYSGEHPVAGPMPWTLEWEAGRERLASTVAFPPEVEMDRRINQAYRDMLDPARRGGERVVWKDAVRALQARLSRNGE